jgi:predicted DsbA family dithiol-disulfide isomerase
MGLLPTETDLRLQVEVVHDLVCPWCYLGLHRLLLTLQRRDGIAFDLVWRPFLLNPDMPPAGMAMADYAFRKFGGPERARRLYGSITDIAAAEELVFRFDRIRRVPSSINAHRLVRWASAFMAGPALARALFAAHFAEGRDIGDRATLSQIAAGCGLDPLKAMSFLTSDDEAEAVHAENLRAHRLGINGVPCFVVGGRHAISGAQEPEVIERLLDVAIVECREG